MGILSAGKRRAALVAAILVGFSGMALASPAGATPGPGAAVVSAMSTTTYGSVLIVGGTGPLAGAPLYEISSDAFGHFGCTTTLETTFQGPITCTGPESDIFNNVQTDEWPALTTVGAPVAGPGVNRFLLGSVYRPGIGRQVTYAGHPLYLFDPPSDPFTPAGEGFFETVLQLPPWHGEWNLVSSQWGQPAPGVATIETDTLPNGSTAVAAEMYPNVIPGGAAITAYTFSLDSHWFGSACYLTCSVTMIPVLSNGTPQVAGGINTSDVGVIRRLDGTEQVTYKGKPLYVYSSEQAVFNAGQPSTTGTVGNGNGLHGPYGGTFSIAFP